jgi:uncharacterized membrane protein
MALAAVLPAEALVRAEGLFPFWVNAGGQSRARDVPGAMASVTIGVAGTTFSITVVAFGLASNQMGPRLLRSFTRHTGNQYALGALVATSAYSLVALRLMREPAG